MDIIGAKRGKDWPLLDYFASLDDEALMEPHISGSRSGGGSCGGAVDDGFTRRRRPDCGSRSMGSPPILGR